MAVEQSFFIFKTMSVDDSAPLRQHGERCTIHIDNELTNNLGSAHITSLCLDSHENQAYVITSTGQMLTGALECTAPKGLEPSVTFKHVQGQFHKDRVTGLDVCVRKQLIVTCSRDKTVSVWDYNTKKLEIQHVFNEECLAVAFHPSGLHIAVAVTAEIHMCNVLANELEIYKTLPIKQCSEIKFAHGGHMFACVQQQKDICVYQFLTNDCQPQMMFVGHHTHRVRCIDWFENDFGFISCCMGGFIFFYDLF